MSVNRTGITPVWLVFLAKAVGYIIGYGIILFLVLFMMAKHGWSNYIDGLKPLILMLPAYFFTIYRPSFFPPFLILCLGLIMDLFMGVPFGLTPIIILGIQFLLHRQSRMIRDWHPVMVTFLAVIPITLAEFLRWAGVSLLSTEFQALTPALMAACWSFVIYLPLSLVFHKVVRLLSIQA